MRPNPARQETDPPNPDVAAAEEQELGEASMGLRGEWPRWVLPALAVVALVLAVANIVVFDWSVGGWLVLAGLLVVLIGVSIALNPRRSSPAGGTADRWTGR